MQASGIPPKFSIPFANSAGTGDIRPIPVPSQIATNPGAASLTDGFPPSNFTPVAAGGIPPSGADFNGLFNQITQWDQWQGAGGPVQFDAAFSSAIGGYPAGARVLSNSGHAIFQSLADNNTADPNTGSALWRVQSSVWTSTVWQATGSANSQIVTLNPAPTSLSQLTGLVLTINSQGTNTGPVVLNFNGLGNVALNFQAGVAFGAGVLNTNAPFTTVFNGSAFVLTSHTSVFTDVGTGGITINGAANASGANIALRGSGATAPNKFIRALNGLFQVINSAYTAAILGIDDTGNLTAAGTVSATGNVTAFNGRLRASFGATGSGDLNAATILNDFSSSLSNATSGWALRPDGEMVQWGSSVSTAVGVFGITFPRQFPTKCSQCYAQEANPAGWTIPVSYWTPTIFACRDLTQNGCNIYIAEWNQSPAQWVGAPAGTAYRFWAVGN